MIFGIKKIKGALEPYIYGEYEEDEDGYMAETIPAYIKDVITFSINKGDIYVGIKGEAVALTATPGKYNDITTTITLTLTQGINYIKIEGYNATVGKVITIDHIELSK